MFRSPSTETITVRQRKKPSNTQLTYEASSVSDSEDYLLSNEPGVMQQRIRHPNLLKPVEIYDDDVTPRPLSSQEKYINEMKNYKYLSDNDDTITLRPTAHQYRRLDTERNKKFTSAHSLPCIAEAQQNLSRRPIASPNVLFASLHLIKIMDVKQLLKLYKHLEAKIVVFEGLEGLDDAI